MLQKRRFKIENLVRDQMPQRLKNLGGKVQVHPLDHEDHIYHLKLKLKEEVEEACNATTLQNLKEEIADILEVLHALAKKHGLRFEHIENARLQKRNERGGFKKGTYVEYVEVETYDDFHPVIQYCLENSEKYPEIR